MRLALIHDVSRLRRERSAITRLCVALVDDGVQLVRLVPSGVDPFHNDRGEQALSLVPRIDYQERATPWQRGARIATLLDDLDRAPPDAIVAMGDGAWGVALSLAEALDCPLVLEVWSLREAERVAALRRLLESPIAACVAGSAAIAEWLRTRVDPGLVHHVPVGVGMPQADDLDAFAIQLRKPPSRSRRRELPQGTSTTVGGHPEPVAFAVVGDGSDLAAQVAALTAIQRLTVELPDLQIALEICGPRGHDLWRAVGRLNLHDRTSTISQGEPLRTLLLGCDALVMPERSGEVRGLALEAMAAGTPVVALRDPMIEWLDRMEPERTAIIVDAATPDAWEAALRRSLSKEGAALIPSAREHVRLHHRASDHAAGLAAICEQAIRGDAIPFAGAG